MGSGCSRNQQVAAVGDDPAGVVDRVEFRELCAVGQRRVEDDVDERAIFPEKPLAGKVAVVQTTAWPVSLRAMGIGIVIEEDLAATRAVGRARRPEDSVILELHEDLTVLVDIDSPATLDDPHQIVFTIIVVVAVPAVGNAICVGVFRIDQERAERLPPTTWPLSLMALTKPGPRLVMTPLNQTNASLNAWPTTCPKELTSEIGRAVTGETSPRSSIR